MVLYLKMNPKGSPKIKLGENLALWSVGSTNLSFIQIAHGLTSKQSWPDRVCPSLSPCPSFDVVHSNNLSKNPYEKFDFWFIIFSGPIGTWWLRNWQFITIAAYSIKRLGPISVFGRESFQNWKTKRQIWSETSWSTRKSLLEYSSVSSIRIIIRQ